MQMWGHVAIAAADHPFGDLTLTPGMIVMMNFADPANPYVVGEFPMQHPVGSIGVAEFETGRLLVVTTGSGGSPIYGYEVRRNGQPTTELYGDYSKPMGLVRLFEYDAANAGIGWPTGYQSLQTTNVFHDCATGQLYVMGGYNLDPFENTSRDRIGVWKLNPTGQPRMTRVAKREVWCEFEFTTRACNMAAASGFHVTPNGDLLLYATTHENDGPGGTVEMAEFSSRDGYDQDGAYRPTAVPGSYAAAVGAPITLDGSASLATLAQAVDNLRNFGDKATSIEFYGACDGRIVSWSWDLDDDGTVDGNGPTPTITPASPGVHPLALTVCSGFGVCHKAVGSLDAPAGTLPETTAVVNGTAGANGWHRSTVNVVLTATGDPTPTEIRWSTTGADAMGERRRPRHDGHRGPSTPRGRPSSTTGR